MSKTVFVTGGTGYMGTRLIPRLLHRGFRVKAVARPGSEGRLPAGVSPVVANVLDGATYASALEPGATFVHLVGVSHPSPAKAREFVEVDQRSALEAIRVARAAAVSHFIYVSVAHPAPVMKEYIDVRRCCEDALRESGLNATILRPWYVLGPGHLWPYALFPFYWIAERVPSLRDGAERLGLVTINQMVDALGRAVLCPAAGLQVWGVPDIRRAGMPAAYEESSTCA